MHATTTRHSLFKFVSLSRTNDFEVHNHLPLLEMNFFLMAISLSEICFLALNLSLGLLILLFFGGVLLSPTCKNHSHIQVPFFVLPSALKQATALPCGGRL